MKTLKVVSMDISVNRDPMPTQVFDTFPLSTDWVTVTRLSFRVDSQGVTCYSRQYGPIVWGE